MYVVIDPLSDKIICVAKTAWNARCACIEFIEDYSHDEHDRVESITTLNASYAANTSEFGCEDFVHVVKVPIYKGDRFCPWNWTEKT